MNAAEEQIHGENSGNDNSNVKHEETPQENAKSLLDSEEPREDDLRERIEEIILRSLEDRETLFAEPTPRGRGGAGQPRRAQDKAQERPTVYALDRDFSYGSDTGRKELGGIYSGYGRSVGAESLRGAADPEKKSEYFGGMYGSEYLSTKTNLDEGMNERFKEYVEGFLRFDEDINNEFVALDQKTTWDTGEGQDKEKQGALQEKTNLQSRPFVCNYIQCNKAFKRFEHLKRHYRIHTGEKPYRCPALGCNKTFSRSDNLNQHMKVHLDTSSLAYTNGK